MFRSALFVIKTGQGGTIAALSLMRSEMCCMKAGLGWMTAGQRGAEAGQGNEVFFGVVVMFDPPGGDAAGVRWNLRVEDGKIALALRVTISSIGRVSMNIGLVAGGQFQNG